MKRAITILFIFSFLISYGQINNNRISISNREKFEIKYKEFVDKDDSIEKQKKKFAKFLKKTNFGVSLFQATDDSFTQWEKINKSGNPTPCN